MSTSTILDHPANTSGIERAAANGAKSVDQPAPLAGAAPLAGSHDQQMRAMIDGLDLLPLQRQYLLARWFEQNKAMDVWAHRAQRYYYTLRLIMILGGVTIPVLLGIQHVKSLAQPVQIVVFGLSLIVAICAAVDGFFHYGDRWRHYRLATELLESEGWQFLELTGPYEHFARHRDAFATFSHRNEAILAHEVDAYIREIMRDRTATGEEQSSSMTGPDDGSTAGDGAATNDGQAKSDGAASNGQEEQTGDHVGG